MSDPAAAGADPLAALTAMEGVASAFAGTRDGIDVMLRDRGRRRTAPGETAEAVLLGMHASAVLEGSATTLEDFREGRLDQVAAAAARLGPQLLGLVPVLQHSPAQVFARLHAVTAVGDLPAERLGRPVSSEAAERLGTLGRTVTVSRQPALLVAAVVHAELATLAPFGSHNGIVARAAERLVLATRGVDPASLVVPEAGHLALRAAYESNLRGFRDGGRRGVQSWLLYAAEAFAAGAEASPLHR